MHFFRLFSCLFKSSFSFLNALTLSPISQKKKEMIETNLTTNTHMRERGELAEAPGHSCAHHSYRP